MASTLRARPSSDRNGSKSTRPGRASNQKSQGKDGSSPVKSSHIITEHIDVGVPAIVAYDQWMQFDKWSEIFKAESADKGKKSDRSTAGGGGSSGPTRVKVQGKIGPSSRQWTTEIVEVTPGRRVRWRSKGPVQAMGTTSFHSLDDRLTALMVEIEYRPTGFLETVGNFFRMQRRRVRRDLRLFKHYIELRGEPTGTGPRRGGGPGLRRHIDEEES